MKKITIVLAFIIVVLNVSAQSSAFNGFFRPVKSFPKVTTDGFRELEVKNFWKVRPILALSAVQFRLQNPVQVSSFTSMGTGLSYQHFIEVNGKPYNNVGINALFLYTSDLKEVQNMNLSFAFTGSFWQYFNIGGGYNFTDRYVFILTAVSYSFN